MARITLTGHILVPPRDLDAIIAEFLTDSGLSGDQIAFVDEIVNHLVRNGTLEPGALFDAPFTNLHDQGVVGIFPKGAKELVATLEQVNANAKAS